MCESMFSCRRRSFMVSCKSEIVCFKPEMVAVCLLFCSIIPENMFIIILLMVVNESTSTDKSAGALSFSYLQSFSASCFNSLKSIDSPSLFLLLLLYQKPFLALVIAQFHLDEASQNDLQRSFMSATDR